MQMEGFLFLSGGLGPCRCVLCGAGRMGCVWCRCAVGIGGWRVVLVVRGVAVSCRVASCHVVDKSDRQESLARVVESSLVVDQNR